MKRLRTLNPATGPGVRVRLLKRLRTLNPACAAASPLFVCPRGSARAGTSCRGSASPRPSSMLRVGSGVALSEVEGGDSWPCLCFPSSVSSQTSQTSPLGPSRFVLTDAVEVAAYVGAWHEGLGREDSASLRARDFFSHPPRPVPSRAARIRPARRPPSDLTVARVRFVACWLSQRATFQV